MREPISRVYLKHLRHSARNPEGCSLGRLGVTLKFAERLVAAGLWERFKVESRGRTASYYRITAAGRVALAALSKQPQTVEDDA